MVKTPEIVAQNPWWVHRPVLADYDQIFARLFRGTRPIFFRRRALELKKGNIYIFRGCRQVGKTTYLYSMIKELVWEKRVPSRHILYLSLDSFTSRRELRNAINFFLDMTMEAEEVYIFLDEITSLEGWNLELKYLADRGVTRKAIIVATGSSAIRLKEKGELLPGRGLEGNEYFFKPLTFREFVLQTAHYIGNSSRSQEFRENLPQLEEILSKTALDIGSELEEVRRKAFEIMPYYSELQYLFRIYLTTGGLPLVINNYLKNRYELDQEGIDPTLAEIFVKSVLGDLSKLQRQETLAREILKAVMEKYGTRYSFSKLAGEIERTHATTIDYLEFLEESFILFIHYAYDFNAKDIKSKGEKKVYFIDPFIYHSVKSYLRGREVWDIITETLENEEVQSNLIEGIVNSHLLAHKEKPYLREGNTFLWAYYDRTKELDAVIRLNHQYRGIEVKYQMRVNERDVKRVSAIRDYLILSRDEIDGKEEILIIPTALFLSLLPASEGNI